MKVLYRQCVNRASFSENILLRSSIVNWHRGSCHGVAAANCYMLAFVQALGFSLQLAESVDAMWMLSFSQLVSTAKSYVSTILLALFAGGRNIYCSTYLGLNECF